HNQFHFNRTGSDSPCAEAGWLYWALGIGMFVTMSVIIIGGLGNTFTILILVHQMCQVHTQQKIRTTSSTVLVLNLAIADLCYSVICLPFIFAIYYLVYTSGLNLEAPLDHGFGEMCRFSAFIRYTNAISEWTTIGLMALERFITISRYSKWQKGGNRWFTPRKSAYYCIVIWILAGICQLPTLLEVGEAIPFFGEFGYNIDTLKCDFVADSKEELEGFGIREFFFLLEAAIPCCLILVGYIAIILKIKNSARFMRRFGTHDCQMRLAMRNSKTTGLCVRLIFVYLVCVVPICVWNVIIPENELGEPCNQIWGIYLYLIYWLQYAINNFIYALSLPRYGNAAKQFLSSFVPQSSRSDAQSFNLNKHAQKKQVVSVVSIEKCADPHS
ncbi:G protein-coupled receptor rhodopsin-like, partial [Trinorchestia longiramus]